MSRPVLVIVGGGVSLADLCSELARLVWPTTPELRLVARDSARLDLIARHCRVLLQREGNCPWELNVCRTLGDALVGASVVVLLIRVGGLGARAMDEEFPAAFGLTGDEGLGPGGYANALRTLPVLDGIARELRAAAPQSTVFNLMAPLGLTTRLLLDGGVRAVGVCELPAVTERELVSRSAELRYAGLNHLGWFWAPPAVQGDWLEAMVRSGRVDPEVARAYGAVPLKYFYRVYDPQAGRRFGLLPPAGRARALIAHSAASLEAFAHRPGAGGTAAAARPTPWFREALVPMISAALGRSHWRGFANVRSAGIADWLPPSAVVETRATWDQHGFRAHPWPREVPEAVRRMIADLERAEDQVYRLRDTDPSAGVAQALRIWGWGAGRAVVPDLTAAIVSAAALPTAVHTA